MSEDEDDRPIERKFVFISIKPETRTELTSLKRGNDTYNDVIHHLINIYKASRLEDYAAQNIDHVDRDDEEREA